MSIICDDFWFDENLIVLRANPQYVFDCPYYVLPGYYVEIVKGGTLKII